jgi:hypothetical protein
MRLNNRAKPLKAILRATHFISHWIPACAGMTGGTMLGGLLRKTLLEQCSRHRRAE